MTITDDIQTKPLKPRCRCDRDGVIRDMTDEEISKSSNIPLDKVKGEYVPLKEPTDIEKIATGEIITLAVVLSIVGGILIAHIAWVV